ncbi:hypothetical protein FRB96_009592 [Tulasnella sp. 330]|nr:hypothetical protein FRB96_009592 [Tulasnella sp. 330]
MSTQDGETDMKPDVKSKLDERIEVAVKTQDGTEIKFRMKMHQKFEKVFASFEERLGVTKGIYSSRSLRYCLRETRLRPENSPNDLELDEDDMECLPIDAFVAQVRVKSMSS